MSGTGGFQSQLSLSVTEGSGGTIGSAPSGVICGIGGGGAGIKGRKWLGQGPTSVLSSSMGLELPAIGAAPAAMLSSEYVEEGMMAAAPCARCGAAAVDLIVAAGAYVHGLGGGTSGGAVCKVTTWWSMMGAGGEADEHSPWSRWKLLSCCVGDSGVEDGEDPCRPVGTLVREEIRRPEEVFWVLEDDCPWPSSMPDRL